MNGNHIYFSNMTPEEEYRLNGTLCAPTIESLLDAHYEIENLDFDGAETYIKEARTCFPAEDVLTTQIQEIRRIANRLRGANKLQLLDAVEQLENIQDELVQQAEYGQSELGKALKCVERKGI
ncbi:hypothetical protein WKH82_17405 [Acinetobacter baumannii]|nr:hypothetical protein [Acinetobacter baumannii]